MRVYLIDGTNRVNAKSDADIQAIFPNRWTFIEELDSAPLGKQEQRKKKLIRADAFWDRLTFAERRDIDLAAQHNSADTQAAKRKAAVIRVRFVDINRDGKVSLSANWLQQLFADFETDGVITVGRAAAILQAPVREDEEP